MNKKHVVVFNSGEFVYVYCDDATTRVEVSLSHRVQGGTVQTVTTADTMSTDCYSTALIATCPVNISSNRFANHVEVKTQIKHPVFRSSSHSTYIPSEAMTRRRRFPSDCGACHDQHTLGCIGYRISFHSALYSSERYRHLNVLKVDTNIHATWPMDTTSRSICMSVDRIFVLRLK